MAKDEKHIRLQLGRSIPARAAENGGLEPTIADFWDVVYPRGYREGYCVILRSYGDESGMEEGGRKVLTVGALLNNPLGWELFEPAWKAVLDHYGIEVFHTTDYEAGEGPYKCWSKAKRIDLMKALMEAIGAARPPVAAVSTSIVLDDYDKLTAAERRRFGTPYEICAQWVIKTISANLGQARVKNFIAFILEERHRQGRLIEAFEQVRLHPAGKEYRFHSIKTAPKKAFVPLQLADLWAFEATKNALREIGAHSRPVRKSYEAMKDRMVLQSTPLFNERGLRKMLHLLDSGIAYRRDS